MATFSKLLEDMVVPIISRLPPKSLLRFRCVSKLWSSLINNPGFVTKNLCIAAHNEFASHTCILFKRTLLKDRNTINEEEIAEIYKNSTKSSDIDVLLSLLYICGKDGGDNEFSFVVEDLHVPFAWKGSPKSTYITGCCDGIVCLTDYLSDNIVLCNPAIKEAMLLTRRNSVLLFDLPEDNHDAIEASVIAVGFGYNPIAKEYKVIRCVEFESEISTVRYTRIEVYTLGASAWREIKTDTISHVSWIPASFGLYIKGFYYWWGSTGPEQEILISIDMSNELFHILSLPVSVRETADRSINSKLAVWGKTISFFSVELDDVEVNKSFQMWVMNDFPGYNSSWTKHLRIGPLYNVEFPLVFWKSDELAVVATNGRIFFCNLETQRLEYLPINGIEEPYCIQAVNYVESIVSLKGHKELKDTDTDNGSWMSYVLL